MGTDNGGSRSWGCHCPLCGRTYVLTNFMALRESDEKPVLWVTYQGQNVPITNTHLRACSRKLGLVANTRRAKASAEPEEGNNA